MKTLQDAFNVMFIGLRAQGFKRSAREVKDSGLSIYKCMYRGPNGLKCALGMLLPDNEYVSKMEGHGVETLAELSPTFAKLCYPTDGSKGVDTDKLASLQSIHDYHSDPSEMEQKFRGFAAKHKLTVPE